MKLDAEELKNRIAPLFEENFTRSIDESMCSTTAQSFARLKNKNRCGRPEPRTVITPVPLVFSSMNSCAVSLGNRWQNIGERFLANLSNLIFGLVCQKERILA